MSKPLRLTSTEIIERIRAGRDFEAIATDTGLRIRITDYVPFICTAIHAGGRMRHELQLKCALDDFERWQEEDPDTDTFINALPIAVIGTDSRYEYDLNRPPDQAVYEEAWGKKVWSRSLTKAEKQRSISRHERFYKVVHELVSAIAKRFGSCVVYDIHSYNWRRWDRPVPTWNIGSHNLDVRWSDEVNSFSKCLSNQPLPHDISSECAVNDVFQGRGYNLASISKQFPNVLVLATEVAKIYCNEETGERYPAIVRGVQSALKQAIIEHAWAFAKRHTSHRSHEAAGMLSAVPTDSLLQVDQQLFQLVRDFEVLNFVNPINISSERKAFFASKGATNPQFEYRPLQLDPFDLKRRLLRIPVETIADNAIRGLYESTISAYLDKVDLLSNLGTPDFLYNSLRYYGRPTDEDLRNAHYLLHLPEVQDELRPEKRVGTEEARQAFIEGMAAYGFKGKVQVTSRIVADAMVNNSERKVLIKKGASFRPKELRYLVHHEIGVHMVTTMNASEQPLKLLGIGTRVSTRTQEGLAVLAEYLSGNTTLKRLRELALRVVAVDMMVQGEDFVEVYRHLTHELDMPVMDAFHLATRVFRGGGLTKDYLYLQGLREVFGLWRDEADLSPLLIGKCSMAYYDTLEEMIQRGMLHPPKYIPIPFQNPSTERNNPIFDYIVSGIK
ncbi:MAG: flavohemoglobin expression-modulating QEGLA motif protein [Flavobacteriales bacterium]